MEGLLKTAQFVGGAAIVVGLVSDFFLYDGKKKLYYIIQFFILMHNNISIILVEPGTRAVIFDKVYGISQKVVSEGTHFKLPYIQVPVIMDIRSKPRTIHSTTGTKDLQMVNISLRVLSRPEESQLPNIYQTLGVDFDDRILPSIVNEVLKAVVAQYQAEELLSKRAEISSQIAKQLFDRAKKFDLILDDVSITHLTFGREFARAIENKQVAQQEAETQFWLVAKADQERKAAVIRAEGEAEAAELISKAMSAVGNALVEVRRIDAAKDVTTALSKGRNVTYLPSSGKSGGSNLLMNIQP